MAFPYGFIEELKAKNSISDIVGSYVTLRRAGSNQVACCPFHNEKTPSFTVFSRNDNFYCFGCGVGGDVITFIMKAENLDYVSAVEFLAKRAGLRMPDDGVDRTESDKRRRTLEANKDAARFFVECLRSSPEATAYVEERSLGRAKTRFGIGFCPRKRNALASHLTSLGYKPAELKDAFLCGISKEGRLFDYFSGRVMFPIIDAQGNVVAFGGRAMGGEQPKYLNSNDTAAFKKSRNVFSLNIAKKSEADSFILCEGYTDVIALHMAGFDSAVASLGTALTQDQANLLKKYKSAVTLCYDGDAAGRKATARAIPILESAGLDVRVVALPDGIDPDEYIKKYGKENFALALKKHEGSVEYRCKSAMAKYNLAVTEERLKAVSDVGDILARIESDVERQVYASKYASTLEIPEDSFKVDIASKRRKFRSRTERETKKQMIRASQGYGDSVNPDMARHTKAGKAEEAILGLLQLSPEFIVRAEKEGLLSEELFVTEFNKKIYRAVKDAYIKEGRFDVSMIADGLTPDEMGRTVSFLVQRQKLSENGYEVLVSCAKTLKDAGEDDPSADATIDDILALINKKSKR